MNIAIVGASGFLGAALVRRLRSEGHTVRTIGRSASSDIQWDTRSPFDASRLVGCDVVINLAGEPIGKRWTALARVELRDSRVRVTSAIAAACAAVSPKPAVLISASAVGAYGSRGDEWLDESSSFGTDYLGDVAREWEGATRVAGDAGVRVVLLRTGIVISPEGGALKEMLLPFRFGLGGKLGDGKQWMSWISREDWLRAVQFAIETPALAGPMNVVSTDPVTNATFAATLGRVLHRPAIAPVPAFVLQTMFGEMADATILASQRVRPTVLQRHGFTFLHNSIDAALRFEMGLL